LNDLCFGQDQLELLCPDRALETAEFHTPNDYYGQASVLKRFAGVDENRCLKAVLEHGVVLDDRMWPYDRDQYLPWILSTSPRRAEQVSAMSGKHAVPIGFGFLYARALVDRTHPKPNVERAGTIVFPCHSTHTVTADYDHDDYAKRIAALPAEVQPVSVCLYWRNYEFQQHKIYERHGIPVYSAGHMFDSDFMLRFYDLCRRFRYAASNVFGTHFFQAVASGCEFFHLPSEDISWDVPDLEKEGAARGTPLGEYQREIESSSRCGWEKIDAVKQRDVVDRVLGTGSMLTPSALTETIEQAERADRLAMTRVRVGNALVPAPPAYVRRRLRFVGRIGRSIKKRLPWRRAA